MKTRISSQQFYVPLTRYDAQTGEFEGWAYVNATVPGEGGIRLLRTAMEEATADYLRHGTGALREMHQPSAAGVVSEVEWRDKGCYVRGRVVDAGAREKCREGVYKGLSVGVLPLIKRGLDVTRCGWPEISLVDRPKDPDAVLTLYRAAAFAAGFDAAAEVEVEEQFQAGDRVRTALGTTGTVGELRGEYATVQGDDETPEPAPLCRLETLTLLERAAPEITAQLTAYEKEQLDLPPSEAGETKEQETPHFACHDPGHHHATLESAYGCMLALPEAAVQALRERAGDPEVTRQEPGITSGNEPVRENLEGREPAAAEPDDAQPEAEDRLHGHLHYDCGAADCHGHRQHAAALRCAMERSDTASVARLEALARGLFAEMVAPLAAQDLVKDFQSGMEAFLACVSQLAFGEAWEDTAPEARARALQETVQEFCLWLLGQVDENAAVFASDDAERGLRAAVTRAVGAKPAAKDGAPQSAPKGYPGDRGEYGDPTNWRYPLDTAEHAKAAWGYWNQPRNQEGYDAAERRFIAGRIKTACRKFGIEISDERAAEALLTRVTGERTDLLARLETLTTERGALQVRAETAETEAAAVQTELSAARERLERLLAEPDPRQQKPALYAAVTRAGDRAAAADPQTTVLRARLAEIDRELPGAVDTAERVRLVAEARGLRAELGRADRQP